MGRRVVRAGCRTMNQRAEPQVEGLFAEIEQPAGHDQDAAPAIQFSHNRARRFASTEPGRAQRRHPHKDRRRR